jgi:1-deoxy-D-xylulose-5-phosphate reductoisomerase
MNKVFEIIEAKKIFNLRYNQLEILVHPKSYLHAMVKFSNGLSKLLVHDTDMTIPIFNSIYDNNEKKIRSKKIDITTLNNLDLNKVDKIRFPVVKIIKKLDEKDTLFETVIVSANDKLVNLFLNNKIRFIDISKFLLKICSLSEFSRFKLIEPKNIDEIKFPVVKIIKKMHEMDTLFETIIVSANDKLVNLFLNNKINFIDISNILLKICSLPEFSRLKLIKPKNIHEINNLADYVSLKIDSMGV